MVRARAVRVGGWSVLSVACALAATLGAPRTTPASGPPQSAFSAAREPAPDAVVLRAALAIPLHPADEVWGHNSPPGPEIYDARSIVDVPRLSVASAPRAVPEPEGRALLLIGAFVVATLRRACRRALR